MILQKVVNQTKKDEEGEKQEEKRKKGESKKRRRKRKRKKESFFLSFFFDLLLLLLLLLIATTTTSLLLSSSHSLQNPPLPPLHCIATLGLTALNTVRCTLDSGLERLVVSGNLMEELWNCFVASRLHRAAGTVAVLIIWRTCERARCLDPISA